MNQDDLILGGKVGGMLSAAGVAVYKFFGMFQTKKGCTVAHANYDKIEKYKQKLRDEQRNNMHNDIVEIKSIVVKMANDFYGPRLVNTRRQD